MNVKSTSHHRDRNNSAYRGAVATQGQVQRFYQGEQILETKLGDTSIIINTKPTENVLQKVQTEDYNSDNTSAKLVTDLLCDDKWSLYTRRMEICLKTTLSTIKFH